MVRLIVRAEVDADQQHELMRTCKSWVASDHLPGSCLERRVYQDAVSPTCLVLVEKWFSEQAMTSYLSSEQFRALIGAVKVLGRLVDIRVSESKVVESG